MTPFAIAGIQMHVSALQSNVEGMRHRLDVLMARFPWTQMVLVQRACAHTVRCPSMPSPLKTRPLPCSVRMPERHNIWLIPGSMFEKTPEGRIFNTSAVINPGR